MTSTTHTRFFDLPSGNERSVTIHKSESPGMYCVTVTGSDVRDQLMWRRGSEVAATEFERQCNFLRSIGGVETSKEPKP